MTRNWKPATKLVHGGSLRSQFGEMSEAIFLTQGFLYETSSAAAEARFKGEDDGFIYARYGSPTNDIFEKRMCLLEGAEERSRNGFGHGRDLGCDPLPAEGRRSYRCGACPLRLLPLYRRDTGAKVRHRAAR